MTYVANVNRLIEGTEWEKRVCEHSFLDDLLAATSPNENKALFNNVSQVWNHDLFFKSMKANGGGKPGADIEARLEKNFGGWDQFVETFQKTATGLFGSGWVWIVQESDGAINLETSSNADRPKSHPLAVLDVWEHAYYLDYQNRRADFVKIFINNLIDWDFAAKRLK